jgi:hypothetical protein
VLACFAGGRRPKAGAAALAELVRRRGVERVSEGAHAVGSLASDWSRNSPWNWQRTRDTLGVP